MLVLFVVSVICVIASLICLIGFNDEIFAITAFIGFVIACILGATIFLVQPYTKQEHKDYQQVKLFYPTYHFAHIITTGSSKSAEWTGDNQICMAGLIEYHNKLYIDKSTISCHEDVKSKILLPQR